MRSYNEANEKKLYNIIIMRKQYYKSRMTELKNELSEIELTGDARVFIKNKSNKLRKLKKVITN